MKQVIVTALLVLTATVLEAQTKKNSLTKFYLETGGGPTSHKGIFAAFGVNAILNNKWIVSAAHYNLNMNPKNLPSDYQRGLTILLVLPFPDEMPSVKMNMINITAGRFFQTGRKSWWITEAGLSVLKGESISFTKQAADYQLFYMSSNYSTTKQSQTTMGCQLKTSFTWAFTRHVGINLGAFANTNSIQSSAGLEFKLMVGWLNSATKSGKLTKHRS